MKRCVCVVASRIRFSGHCFFLLLSLSLSLSVCLSYLVVVALICFFRAYVPVVERACLFLAFGMAWQKSDFLLGVLCATHACSFRSKWQQAIFFFVRPRPSLTRAFNFDASGKTRQIDLAKLAMIIFQEGENAVRYVMHPISALFIPVPDHKDIFLGYHILRCEQVLICKRRPLP